MLQIKAFLEDKAIRLKSPVLNISTRSYAKELGIDLNSQLWTLEAVKRDFYVYITFLSSVCLHDVRLSKVNGEFKPFVETQDQLFIYLVFLIKIMITSFTCT